MSKQKDLFTKTITVGEIIESWQKMLDKVGSEINRLEIKESMMRHEKEQELEQ